MGLALTCAIGVGVGIWGGYHALRWHYRRIQDAHDDVVKGAIIEDPDLPGDATALLVGSDDSSKSLPHSRAGRHMYINSVVAKVKTIMGTPTHNAANILVARRIARQTMEEHGVRPTHISKILPLAVEAVFVESTHERDARTWGERVRSRRDKWFRWLTPTEPSC